MPLHNRYRSGGYLRPWMPTNCGGIALWNAPASAQNEEKQEERTMVGTRLLLSLQTDCFVSRYRK